MICVKFHIYVDTLSTEYFTTILAFVLFESKSEQLCHKMTVIRSMSIVIPYQYDNFKWEIFTYVKGHHMNL